MVLACPRKAHGSTFLILGDKTLAAGQGHLVFFGMAYASVWISLAGRLARAFRPHQEVFMSKSTESPTFAGARLRQLAGALGVAGAMFAAAPPTRCW
jgi:hypothetical protein